MNTKIPKSVLDILSNGPWKSDEYSLSCFDFQLKNHKSGDYRDGGTCKISVSDDKDSVLGALTFNEMYKLINERIIDDCFIDEKLSINQHYLHSLHQFFAVCTKEWENHIERTNKLIGTPSGRIWK